MGKDLLDRLNKELETAQQAADAPISKSQQDYYRSKAAGLIELIRLIEPEHQERVA